MAAPNSNYDTAKLDGSKRQMAYSSSDCTCSPPVTTDVATAELAATMQQMHKATVR